MLVVDWMSLLAETGIKIDKVLLILILIMTLVSQWICEVYYLDIPHRPSVSMQLLQLQIHSWKSILCRIEKHFRCEKTVEAFLKWRRFSIPILKQRPIRKSCKDQPFTQKLSVPYSHPLQWSHRLPDERQPVSGHLWFKSDWLQYISDRLEKVCKSFGSYI